MMKFKEVALSDASTEAKVAGLALLLDKELLRLSELVLNTKKLQGPKGEQGLQGPKGEQGDRGFDGTNGKDGVDGAQGPRGDDGRDGVGVQDAHIDFDGSLVITLTDGREINAGDVVPMDVAEKIKVIGNGGGTSQGVLDAIDAINAVIATYGTMALQDDTAVDINGGAIDGTTIGAAVPASGVFTTLTATGQTSLGGRSSDNTDVVRVYKDNTIAGTTASFTAPALSFIPPQSGFGAGLLRSSTQLNVSTGTATPIVLQTAATLGFGGTEQARIAHTASAVNYVQVTGGATTAQASISAQGSDSGITLGLSSKGTNTVSFYTNNFTTRQAAVIHTAGTIANYATLTGNVAGSSPSFGVAGSDTNIGLNLTPKGTGTVVVNGPFTTTGQTEFQSTSVAGPTQVFLRNTSQTSGYMEFAVTDGTRFAELGLAKSSTNSYGNTNEAFVRASGSTAGLAISSPSNTRFINGTSGSSTEQMRVANTASAVNYVQVTGAATGGGVQVTAQGSDANVFLDIKSKGSYPITFYTGTAAQFSVASTANAVNRLQVAGAAAGASPVLSTFGSDTNIDLTLTPKGTGLVRFGTYTAGAPAATGYISIKAADGTTYKLLVST